MTKLRLRHVLGIENQMKLRPYQTATKAVAGIAVAAAAGGCAVAGATSARAGAGKSIGGAYLYTSADGATVMSLNIVRHGSYLTGNAEALAAVTSEQAQYAAGVLDAHSRPVPGTPTNSPVYDSQTGQETAPTDNAACGGTPMCFQDTTGSVDGQLGANSRISIRIVWNEEGLATPPVTGVGELRGRGFVVDGAQFRRSDGQGIAAARSKAPTFLRKVTMPAYAIHQEVSGLQTPPTAADSLEPNTPWDAVLAQDLSTLQSDSHVDLKTQLGCGYSDVVTRDIEAMQSDVTAEGAEITKAEKLLNSMTPAVARQAGGDVAAVRAEIAARKADLLRNVRQANTTVGQANAEAPKVENLLQQLDCGVLDIAFHAILEAGD